MDNRRSITSSRSRRSKSAGHTLNKSAGGTKSRKSIGSRKSKGGKYSKLKDADEIEMADLGKIGGDMDLIGPIGVV